MALTIQEQHALSATKTLGECLAHLKLAGCQEDVIEWLTEVAAVWPGWHHMTDEEIAEKWLLNDSFTVAEAEELLRKEDEDG